MSHAEQMADLKGLDIDHGNRIEVANIIPFLKNLARLTHPRGDCARAKSICHRCQSAGKCEWTDRQFQSHPRVIMSLATQDKMQHDKIAVLKYFAEWFSDGECCITDLRV
jgi:hypothetical protein